MIKEPSHKPTVQTTPQNQIPAKPKPVQAKSLKDMVLAKQSREHALGPSTTSTHTVAIQNAPSAQTTIIADGSASPSVLVVPPKRAPSVLSPTPHLKSTALPTSSNAASPEPTPSYTARPFPLDLGPPAPSPKAKPNAFPSSSSFSSDNRN